MLQRLRADLRLTISALSLHMFACISFHVFSGGDRGLHLRASASAAKDVTPLSLSLTHLRNAQLRKHAWKTRGKKISQGL